MSQVPATQADMQFANTGLEDFGVSDAVLPRIKIVQKRGVWLETTSNLEYTVLRFVPLGLIKQRVLFHHNVEDNDVPMCKSSDHDLGFVNQEAPEKKSFPWDISGFNPADFPPDAEGNRKLPCDGCKLKDWGSNPTSESPYCSEQWTLPIYYETTGTPDGDSWAPAILTLQKSNIKPIRQYFTQFAQSNTPPFLSVARGSLTVKTRGQVEYSIATFIREGESDRNRWMEFSEQYAEMRTYLTRPPTSESPVDDAPDTDNTYTGPPQQTIQQPPPATDPWATQAQPASQPVAAQPAPVQQEVPQPPPAQVPQPVAAQPAPQPVAAQPAPPQQAPAPAADPQVAPVQQDPWGVQPASPQPVAAQPAPPQPVAAQPAPPQPVAAQPAPVAAQPAEPVAEPAATPAPASSGLPF